MVRKEGLEMTGKSDCDTGVTGRAMHPLVMWSLPSTRSVKGQQRSWTEADPAGRDAPISVWWDHPPSGGPG